MVPVGPYTTQLYHSCAPTQKEQYTIYPGISSVVACLPVLPTE